MSNTVESEKAFAGISLKDSEGNEVDNLYVGQVMGRKSSAIYQIKGEHGNTIEIRCWLKEESAKKIADFLNKLPASVECLTDV